MIRKLLKPIADWIDSVNPYHPEKLGGEGLKPIEIEEAGIKKKAARWFLGGFGLFVLWAFFAPLDAGVNVNGQVFVMGYRKAVQHPTGGVVDEILVNEGSKVKQGDVLIRINPLSLQADLNSAELDYINALATESRLTAERLGYKEITWLTELQAFGDTRVDEAKKLQTQFFRSRREEFNGQQSILVERLGGLAQQLDGLTKVVDARKQQLYVMEGEAKSAAELAGEGFIPKSKANEVERNRSELFANVSTVAADMAKTKADMASAKLEASRLLSAFHKDIDGQLADVQKNRKALKAKVDSLRFNLQLSSLRAPVSGVVVGLKTYTVGGVIHGGDVLMEIVPQQGHLIVEAKVPTNLIDKVHVGLDADVRFSAFNVSTTPVVPGKVVRVGADIITSPGSEEPKEYYLAQVEATDLGQKMLGGKIIQPGMPVEVIVKTGERSFVSYILKPLSDRFARSFKED